MLKAIIFDFDGTLADTIPALCEGINQTMQLYGYPTHQDADILRFINNGARELVRRAMPKQLQGDEELVSRVLSDYDKQYSKVYLHTDRTYAGVRELVEYLHRELKLKIGVLSNKQDRFVKGLCRQVLAPDSYDTAQGVIAEKPAKPDPYLAHLVADALGVSPEECAMVGDSDVDIHTAKNAGMLHLGVTWGYRDEAFLRASGATRLANTPDELLNLILQETENQPC